MARSAITVRTLTPPRGGLVADPATHYDPANSTDNHEFAHPGGKVLLCVFNRSGASMTVVITAVAGPTTKQMAEDITRTVPNGDDLLEVIAYDDGYVGADGNVDIDIDQEATSFLTVIKIA
jgi:hypothetical protein